MAKALVREGSIVGVKLNVRPVKAGPWPLDVKIVWQGGRIARLVFTNGVVVEFSRDRR